MKVTLVKWLRRVGLKHDKPGSNPDIDQNFNRNCCTFGYVERRTKEDRNYCRAKECTEYFRKKK